MKHYFISYELVENDMASKTSRVIHRGNAKTNMTPAAFAMFMSESQDCVCHISFAQLLDFAVSRNLDECRYVERIDDYEPLNF